MFAHVNGNRTSVHRQQRSDSEWGAYHQGHAHAGSRNSRTVATGSGPEEICRQLPHLNLAQVFDALSYYSDHQDEITAHIERNHIPDDLAG